MRYIRVIGGVVAALAFAATASAGPVEDKAQVTLNGAESGDVTVAIDISEKAFHVTKGGTAQGFTLIAGAPTVNESPRSKLRGITELNFADFSEAEANPVASYGECSSSRDATSIGGEGCDDPDNDVLL